MTRRRTRTIVGLVAILAVVLVLSNSVVPVVLTILSSHREPFSTSPFQSLPTCDEVARTGIPIVVDAGPGPGADAIGGEQFTGDAYWTERLYGILPIRAFAHKSTTQRRCGSNDSTRVWLTIREFRSERDTAALKLADSGGTNRETRTIGVPGATRAVLETTLWGGLAHRFLGLRIAPFPPPLVQLQAVDSYR